MSKSTLLFLSLLGVISTLYVYDYPIEYKDGFMRLLTNRRTAVTLPPRKTLIWLMGYPGAGSNQTINMIERATDKSMATNYGATTFHKDRTHETNVYVSQWLQKSWYKEGVFINNKDLPADTSQVYVKTFCTGYCLYEENSGFCTRIPYIRALGDIGRFWLECARGDIYLPPRKRKWNKVYWKNRVKKILVLVRNPMEIVVSRFLEYARQPENAGAKKARTGLLPFCELVDNNYANVKEMKAVLRRKWRDDTGPKFLKDYIEGVPCWTEFYRIFIWYEHTHYLATQRENLVVYREDFDTDHIGTAMGVLNFAGLERLDGREIIPIGDNVNMMFSAEEIEKISIFMRAIRGFSPSPMWDQYFARYF